MTLCYELFRSQKRKPPTIVGGFFGSDEEHDSNLTDLLYLYYFIGGDSNSPYTYTEL